jgi:hypothetical protein
LRHQKLAIEQTIEELLSIDRQALAWLDGSPVKPVRRAKDKDTGLG